MLDTALNLLACNHSNVFIAITEFEVLVIDSGSFLTDNFTDNLTALFRLDGCISPKSQWSILCNMEFFTTMFNDYIGKLFLLLAISFRSILIY